jgi:hypothetical protein
MAPSDLQRLIKGWGRLTTPKCSPHHPRFSGTEPQTGDGACGTFVDLIDL